MANMSSKDDLEAPALFSIATSARRLGGISPWTLRKHVVRGSVRVVRIGRRVFLQREEIERVQREGLPRLSAAEHGGRATVYRQRERLPASVLADGHPNSRRSK